MSSGADIDDLPEIEEAEALTRDDAVDAKLSEVRQDLYVRAAMGLQGILGWSEVTPDMEKPPDEWVEKWGEKRAAELLRIARAAHAPTRDAPAGLKLTVELFRGLESARATDKLATPQVAVQVNIGAAPAPLPEKVIERDPD